MTSEPEYPVACVIAVRNWAEKETFATEFLPRYVACSEFLSAGFFSGYPGLRWLHGHWQIRFARMGTTSPERCVACDSLAASRAFAKSVVRSSIGGRSTMPPNCPRSLIALSAGGGISVYDRGRWEPVNGRGSESQ